MDGFFTVTTVDLNPTEQLWKVLVVLYHHHQNGARREDVHPSSSVSETCQVKVKLLWLTVVA